MPYQYNAILRPRGPVLRQSMSDQKVANKFQEPCNFEIEVKNIFMTNNYNIQENNRVPIILNWLGWEGLRFMQTLDEEEQEKCRTIMGLFKVLCTSSSPSMTEQFCHCNTVN